MCVRQTESRGAVFSPLKLHLSLSLELHSSMAAMNSQSSLSSSSSSSSSYIPLHKTQCPPRMYPFSLSPPPNPRKSRHHKHLFLIICLSFLPFLLYLLSLYRSLHLPSSPSFGLVIRVSHYYSRILVFRSLNEVSGTPFSGQTSYSTLAHPGLSGSAPDVLGRVVSKLLKFAEDKVPSSEWKGTKVQLMITAEEDGVERVLEECRRVLRSSGLLFRENWASILRGQDEGLYNWLAVNYALGYIGNKPEETAGVIVLGKSAMQVSFARSEPPVSNFTRAIRLAGVSYHLYTQSMQQLGQDVIWKLLHEQGSQDLRSCKFQLDMVEGCSCEAIWLFAFNRRRVGQRVPSPDFSTLSYNGLKQNVQRGKESIL